MKLSIEALRQIIRKRIYESQTIDINPDMWMVPYVNLMTILMIFFLILYAFTQLNKNEYEKRIIHVNETLLTDEQRAKKEEELERVGRFEQVVWNNAAEKFVELDLTSQRILITLKEPILFEKGKAELKMSADIMLTEVADFIRMTRGRVTIEGHTDDLPVVSGAFKSNWDLAAVRAYAIMEYLIRKEQIPPQRFVIQSYAQYKPVAENISDENRAKNRRIEISIKKESENI